VSLTTLPGSRNLRIPTQMQARWPTRLHHTLSVGLPQRWLARSLSISRHKPVTYRVGP